VAQLSNILIRPVRTTAQNPQALEAGAQIAASRLRTDPRMHRAPRTEGSPRVRMEGWRTRVVGQTTATTLALTGGYLLMEGDFKPNRKGRRINVYLIRRPVPFTRSTRSALQSEEYGHPGGHLETADRARWPLVEDPAISGLRHLLVPPDVTQRRCLKTRTSPRTEYVSQCRRSRRY